MKKAFSFRFEEKIILDAAKVAKSQNRSLTNLIETVLIDFIKKQKQHDKQKES